MIGRDLVVLAVLFFCVECICMYIMQKFEWQRRMLCADIQNFRPQTQSVATEFLEGLCAVRRANARQAQGVTVVLVPFRQDPL
jgi:hypothetical protein